MRRRWKAAALAAALQMGCARYVPQPVSVADHAAALEQRSVESAVVHDLVLKQLPDVAWPPAQWTPELLALAAVALHPDLDVARAELGVARAALRTAGERPNPTVTAGLERMSGSGSASPWISTLSFDVPIETAGKRGTRVAQAHALSNAAAAEVDQAIWNVRTRAANAVVDLAASRRFASIHAGEAALREEVVAMLERRLAVGEAAQPDVTRARAEARAARLIEREEEGRASEREAALAAAIGIPHAALPPLDLSALTATRPRVDDSQRLRELALTARPDILAALARYDAAEQALRLEIARQYPDLHIGPGLGWDQGAFKWSLSLAAELPIFNRHGGAIAEADARRSAEGARLLALQSKIVGELETALALARGATARLGEAERVLASRKALAASAQKQFKAGEIDRLALRNQEIETALAEADVWTATFDLNRAAVAVEAAVEQPIGGVQ